MLGFQKNVGAYRWRTYGPHQRGSRSFHGIRNVTGVLEGRPRNTTTPSTRANDLESPSSGLDCGFAELFQFGHLGELRGVSSSKHPALGPIRSSHYDRAGFRQYWRRSSPSQSSSISERPRPPRRGWCGWCAGARARPHSKTTTTSTSHHCARPHHHRQHDPSPHPIFAAIPVEPLCSATSDAACLLGSPEYAKTQTPIIVDPPRPRSSSSSSSTNVGSETYRQGSSPSPPIRSRPPTAQAM